MLLHTFLLIYISSTALAAPSSPTSDLQPGPSVSTTSGTIEGYTHTKFRNVYKFLGIPFAKPPTGQLRFAPPQPFCGKETIQAKHQSLSCPQTPVSLNYSWPEDFFNIQAAGATFANRTSEDCLYLDVYTTSVKPDKLKPVMVWLYGGGFHAGGVSDITQGGGIYAAENDVVFVKSNYRLGIFGFSGNPGGTQNAGLLDQRLALEWIRDNIKAFGGDPSRITLYGHSAGGASVDYHSYAWKDDPIFNSAIIMSGTTTSFGNRFPNTTAAGWQETAKLLGCNNSSANETAVCMQSRSTEEVLASSLNATKLVLSTLGATGQLYGGITGLFGPTIDNRTVFENYTDLGMRGQFAKTPYMLGSNDAEGCFFVEAGSTPANQSSLITEVVFSCPIFHQASFRARQGLKTWKYFYGGAYPNLDLPACPGKPWHGQEIYVMWESAEIASKQANTQAELDQGTYMRKVWSAFAHDSENALCSQFGWPTVAQEPNGTNALGFNSTLYFNVKDLSQVNGQCEKQFTQGAPNF